MEIANYHASFVESPVLCSYTTDDGSISTAVGFSLSMPGHRAAVDGVCQGADSSHRHQQHEQITEPKANGNGMRVQISPSDVIASRSSLRTYTITKKWKRQM